MKTKLLTTLAATLLAVIGFQYSLNAQALIKAWDFGFGGTGSDNLRALQQTNDGGYILGGYSASGLSGDKTQASWGSNDYWIVKIDASGLKQWDARFGGSSVDNLYALQQTNDGGYILGGASLSGISGDKTQAGWGNYDYWVVKIDDNGLKQWDARFGGSANDQLSAVQQTNDGGYILGGYTISGISGDKTQASRGNYDMWVVKTDGSGVKQWDARFGGNATDDIWSIVQTSDGGYILGGFSSSAISGDQTQAPRGSVSSGDYWVVKIDDSGNKQWDARFGGSASDLFGTDHCLRQTTDGGYIIGGASPSGISGDKTQSSQGSYDYWVVKINSSGVKQWDVRFGGSGSDQLLSLQQANDGGYLLGGISTSGTSEDKSQASQGSDDYWVVKIDSNGNKQWDARFGGTGIDDLRSLQQTDDGGYLLGGYSASGISGDKTQVSQGSNDFWVVKLIGCPNVWTAGAGTSDWFTPSNWSNDVVPDKTCSAQVPPISSNIYPVLIGTVNAEVYNLTIDVGASVTLNFPLTGGIPQAELMVNGMLTNNGNVDLGAGYLTMKGSSIAGNVIVDFLKIENATGVSLASGATVGVRNELDLVSGNFNTSAGTLTLKSDATTTGLVNDWGGNTGTITGNITIERYIPSGAVNNFHYIGSARGGSTLSIWTDDFANTATAADGTPVTPTSDCNPLYLDAGSAYGSVFSYDESLVMDCYLSGWRVNGVLHATNRGDGFAATITGGTVIDETAFYINTNVDVNNLSITSANIVNHSKGYHLVANPFFAPIDWSAMATVNNGLNNHMDATAYIYNPNTGTYGIYNFISGGYITTNMAFFVRHVPTYSGSTYNVRFDASTRTTYNNDDFLRQRQPYEYGLSITADNGSFSDQTLIAFDSTFTDGYDNGYDAGKLLSSHGIPSLYTLDTSSQRLAIQALGINTEIKSVPLGLLVPGASGSYTLSFDGIPDFPATEIIWLEDLKTNSIQYLRQNNIYTCVADESDNPDRFIIHFAPELLLTTTIVDCNGENGSIILQQRGGIEWNYSLKDSGSTEIANNTFNATDTIDNLQPGIYMLDLNHVASGYSTSVIVNVNGLQPVTVAINASSTEVLEDDTFTVDAQISGSTNYTWDMGDGTTFNNQQVVTHSYTTPGTYEIILSASNGDCSAEARQQIVVNEKEDTVSTSIPDIDAGVISIYANDNVLHILQTVSKKDIDARIIIYNTLGKTVLQYKCNLPYNTIFEMPLNAAIGIYYAAVHSEEGYNKTGKIILTGEGR